ncbi:MAG: malate dehydrogenase [Spirochaetes bacterium]|jgi:malate dehydrogenase|nr:malate dehydrogenase [Spirochaetota bacterium]
MANIGIIGSGNVGANTAFFIAEKVVGDVLLHDIQEGLSKGKALDMMEAAPIRGYRTEIHGTDTLDEVMKSPIVIVAAGAVRQPGMKREDLFDQNKSMIADLAKQAQGSSSVFLVATEPVDLLTTVFVRESKLPRKQVLGLGAVLDSTRMRYLIATELGVAMDNVSATVVGRHSDAMIPLPDYTTVSGVPVTKLLTPERLGEIFEKTRRAGDLIVEMAQRANSYYAPSAAACDVAEAVHRNTRRIIPLSVMLEGEYGIDGVAMNLPVVVGRNGAERVLLPNLSANEESQFKQSADDLKNVLGNGA